MAKAKIRYICTNCATVHVRWEGKCPSCKEWNTLEEEIISDSTIKSAKASIILSNPPIRLEAIGGQQLSRISIPSDVELQRVLGGGIVPGALVLIGGQPGIGKSTLMLQLACQLNKKILYVSGEESEYQIKLRADRIAQNLSQCYVLCQTNLEQILHHAREVQPDILLIDSIQTIASSTVDSIAGSVTQIRYCTSEIQQFVKSTNTPGFIIGHITKEGALAGPKILEHIVDVVLHFEGDRNYMYRILRTIKNRFGSTDEIGIYEMQSNGLRPVVNPSELLISPNSQQLSGTSIGCTIEGARPLLIESQALVSTTVYGHPQRSSTGFDNRRLSMLLAVLEKKCHLFFSQHDVFLNIAGGIRIADPAIDLSIIAALTSSLKDIPIDKTICFAGEVGLSGEVRAVSKIEQRIQEAERLGFEQIFISKYYKDDQVKDFKLQISPVGNVSQLIEQLFT